METQKTPVRAPQRSEVVSGNETKGLKPIPAEQQRRTGVAPAAPNPLHKTKKPNA
ncbi:MAG TPA: hypothetical protein VIJ85_04250 [Rhizomicrobium sp.]